MHEGRGSHEITRIRVLYPVPDFRHYGRVRDPAAGEGPDGEDDGARRPDPGCGDAFHLIPRVLDHFANGDFTAALGIGKLVTSVTMTVFYVLLFYIWKGVYGEKEKSRTAPVLYGLAALRIALCLFPQNGWLQNSSDMTWGILRNVPFVILGGIVCLLYWRKRGENRTFRRMWLYILLSFLFYIPVAVGAGAAPALGMLMLPKTVCYAIS